MGWGSGNLGGGSGGLNFKIVGGTSEPSNPKENMIWVNTNAKITSWIFSATEPAEPVEGMVWITVGTFSVVEFNALKKNGIQIYPMTAKQYANGVLVDVTCESYQGGKWVDWWNGEIYGHGDQYEHITGGWVAIESGLDVDMSGDSIIITGGTYGQSTGAVIMTKKKIDLSPYSKIIVSANNQSYNYNSMRLIVASTNTSVSPDTVSSVDIPRTDSDTSLDISSLNGEYYVGIDASSEVADCEIIKIRLVQRGAKA